MANKFKEDDEIESELNGDQILLHDSIQRELFAENTEIASQLEYLEDVVIINRDSYTNIAIELGTLKNEIRDLKQLLKQSREHKIKQSSRANNKKLRKLFDLSEQPSKIDPKIQLSGLLSEYEIEEDSLDILDEIRERD